MPLQNIPDTITNVEQDIEENKQFLIGRMKRAILKAPIESMVDGNTASHVNNAKDLATTLAYKSDDEKIFILSTINENDVILDENEHHLLPWLITTAVTISKRDINQNEVIDAIFHEWNHWFESFDTDLKVRLGVSFTKSIDASGKEQIEITPCTKINGLCTVGKLKKILLSPDKPSGVDKIMAGISS